ncbi:MAG: oligosaccharide flippase family protein [Polyangiaceae bacterium]
MAFGLKVATSRIIYHGYRNLDYIVIGKAFGTQALGIYRVAFEIAMSPAMSVLNVLNGAAFPVYSRLAGDRSKLKESFVWTTRNLAVLIGPIAVFLAFSAPNLVPLAGGAKWLDAVPLVRVLCWAALLRCLAHLTPQLLHAAGRPDLAIYDSLITLCMLALAFGSFLGLPALKSWGLMGIAWGWVVAYPPILFALWLFARRVVTLGLWEYARKSAGGRAGQPGDGRCVVGIFRCCQLPRCRARALRPAACVRGAFTVGVRSLWPRRQHSGHAAWRAGAAGMSSLPSVSVVVRSHRRTQVLLKLLERALDQDHPNYEVVVIEQTPDLAPELRAELDALESANAGKLRVAYFPPLGAVRARNEAWKAARNQVVLFIDDDDLPVGREWVSRPRRELPRSVVHRRFGSARLLAGRRRNGVRHRREYSDGSPLHLLHDAALSESLQPARERHSDPPRHQHVDSARRDRARRRLGRRRH